MSDACNPSKRLSIIVEPDEDSFYAYCPELPEVHTCGETQEEATQNARNAIQAVLRVKGTARDDARRISEDAKVIRNC